MGGHEKGEVASATVCETICSSILSGWNPNEALSDELFLQALSAAYDALDAKDNGEERKMGTTLTFLCLHTNGATVAHIGDSRVYQFLFDADFYFVITPEVIPTMYYLDQDNTIRSEVIE